MNSGTQQLLTVHALLQMIGDSTSDLKASTSGRNEYGSGVDVWAAAVLAYELMLGGPPFEADTKAKTYNRILTEDPFLPSMWSADAHDFLTQVCTPHTCPQSHCVLPREWGAGPPVHS